MANKDKHPCMEYVRAWDTAEADEYEKFQKNVNGSDLRARVPIADGSRGIEHLVSVVWEAFDKARTKLVWTVGETWDSFEQCMHGNYLEFWQNARDMYAVNQRTAANFNRARLNMTVLMKGPSQRDTMFYYLQNKLKKPDDIQPQDHLMRHMALMRASKKLQGTKNPPTVTEEKDWYISQYHQEWREKYDFKHDGGISDPNQTLITITEFMQKIWDRHSRKKHNAQRRRSKKRKHYGHRHSRSPSRSSSSGSSSSSSSSSDDNKHHKKNKKKQQQQAHSQDNPCHSLLMMAKRMMKLSQSIFLECSSSLISK
mmetsp:Transcript_19211/g.41628  ORF Transcript_19211/g.41628 Transcript_19211/m.41628 type:complete len:312 (-) Transcript_19211:83-1018(-)